MFSSRSCRLLGVIFRSIIHFELIFKIYLIYLFLAVLGLHCHVDVPLVLVSRGYLGLSLRWLPVLQGTALGHTGFSSWGT